MPLSFATAPPTLCLFLYIPSCINWVACRSEEQSARGPPSQSAGTFFTSSHLTLLDMFLKAFLLSSFAIFMVILEIRCLPLVESTDEVASSMPKSIVIPLTAEVSNYRYLFTSYDFVKYSRLAGVQWLKVPCTIQLKTLHIFGTCALEIMIYQEITQDPKNRESSQSQRQLP